MRKKCAFTKILAHPQVPYELPSNIFEMRLSDEPPIVIDIPLTAKA